MTIVSLNNTSTPYLFKFSRHERGFGSDLMFGCRSISTILDLVSEIETTEV